MAGQLRLGHRREHRRRPGRLDPSSRPLRPRGTPGSRPGHAPLPDLAHPRPPRPSRPPADPEDQPGLAVEGGVPDLLAAALHPASTRLTSTDHPSDRKEHAPGAVGAGVHPGTPGTTTRPPLPAKQTPHPKPGSSTISRRTSSPLND